MKKYLVAILFLSSLVHAQFDINLAASGRSYPGLGGSLYFETGYNWVFWENDSEVMYGLIRPAVYLDSSVVINTYGQKIGFYPISFFGIEIGKETVDSQYEDFTFYDCEVVACRGVMEREFVTYKLGFSAANLVSTATITYYKNQYDYDLEGAPVGEFMFTTLAQADEDEIYFSRYVLGLKALGGFIGVISDFAQMVRSTQTYESNYFLYGFKTEMGSISLGAGNLKSDEVDPAAVFYFRWSYWPLPSRMLF